MKKQKIMDEGQASGSKTHYDLYRMSSGGQSLNEALKKFVDDAKISPDLAEKVLNQFEKSMAEALSTKPIHNATIRVHLLVGNPRQFVSLLCRPCRQGHLHSVKKNDDDYTFMVTNTIFYMWDPIMQRIHPGENAFVEEPDGMVKIIAAKALGN